jgi:glycine/D-amino acid oxidase-like deaminating enzyme
MGAYCTDAIVNSAGAWAYEIAKRVGESLPRTHEAYSLMVTARMPKFVDSVVLGVGRTLSFKQTESGSLVIGGGFLGNPDLDRGTAATVGSVHSRMIDRNAALSHHFFDVSQAQRVGSIPAHASHDHIDRIMQAFEHSATAGSNVFIELSAIHSVPRIIADRLTALEPRYLHHSRFTILPTI